MTLTDSVQAVAPGIDALLARKERVLVAIDGCCGAGKTTLGEMLAERCGCTLIHMDDFFLRPEQRTQQRYAEPGGNVDYERFREEVLLPLKAGKPFAYRPFDCKTLTLKEPVFVEPGALTIVEGSYSQHPYFEGPYDLKIFLTVDPELQRRRILERPAFLHRQFFEQWIPMENRYFEAFQIAEKADIGL